MSRRVHFLSCQLQLHTAAIAKTAGVKEIVMVTSPSESDLNPAVAYAAYKSGVTEILFVGGAQGIAGVAIGTESDQTS